MGSIIMPDKYETIFGIIGVIIEIGPVVLSLLVSLCLLLCIIRDISHGSGSRKTILFAFGMACMLLSNIYWIIYDILRSGQRMPFAANEISEWALFLLLGAALSAAFPKKDSALFQKIFAAVFATANTALWIAWSGEWIQDVVTGLCLLYFLCNIAQGAKDTKALGRIQWAALSTACVLSVTFQALCFFLPESYTEIYNVMSEPLSSLSLSAFVLYSFVKALKLRSSGERDKSSCYAFIAYALCLCGMYMTSGLFYVGFYIANSVFTITIYRSFAKEGGHDIR